MFHNLEDGSTKKHKCSTPELNEAVEPIGNDKYKCQIKVTDPEDKFKTVEWAARFEDDIHSRHITLQLAKPIVTKIIEAGTEANPGVFKAKEKGTVSCTFVGGFPKPIVELLVDGKDEDPAKLIVNRSSQEKETDQGISVTHVFTILPLPEYNGKKLSCQAEQYDGKHHPLYDADKSDSVVLNVTFAPELPEGGIKMSAEIGEDAKTTITFKSNPAPILVNVIISTPGGAKLRQETASSDNEKTEVTLYPGKSDEKYVLTDIESEDDITFSFELTIKNLTKEDVKKSYRLEVNNSEGQLTKEFKVKIGSGQDTGTDNGGTDTGTSGSSSKKKIMFGILIAVIILALVLGFVFIYRSYVAKRSVAPLSAQESR